MIARFRDGRVPEAEAPAELSPDFDGLAQRVCEALDRVELSGALDEIWQRVRRLNRYVQDEEPWQLAKDPAQAERLDSILYGLAEGLRVVSVLVHPYMPDSAERLLAALGREDRSIEGARFGAAPGGASCGELEPLFPRVEPEADEAA
jgi:methionyl-tRNA synthetase